MKPYPFEPELRQQIKTRLERHSVGEQSQAGLRNAAVAIVLATHTETRQASFLLTLRPEKLNRHGGQYALPGGRLDEGETEPQAALRELEEELGLTLSEDDILGRLDDYPTRSGFRITPIVLWCNDTSGLRPDPTEVARVFSIPLQELDDPDIPRLISSPTGDHPVLSAFIPTLGHYLYAPTAAILYQFREVALRGEKTRVAHFDQPKFAWK